MEGCILLDYLYRSRVTPSEAIGLGVRSYVHARLTPQAKFTEEKRELDFFQVTWGVDGRGLFFVDDEQLTVNREEVLVVCPGMRCFFRAVTPEWECYTMTFDGPAANRTFGELRLWTGVFKVGPAPVQRFEIIKRALSETSEASEREASSVGFHMLRFISTNRVRFAEDPLVERAQEIIQSQWLDPKLTANDIADALDVHRGTLASHFKKCTGLSVWQYVTRVRMQHATQLLRQPNTLRWTIGDIASRCGYDDANLFARLFRRHVGKSPTDFRKSLALSCTTPPLSGNHNEVKE